MVSPIGVLQVLDSYRGVDIVHMKFVAPFFDGLLRAEVLLLFGFC